MRPLKQSKGSKKTMTLHATSLETKFKWLCNEQSSFYPSVIVVMFYCSKSAVSQNNGSVWERKWELNYAQKFLWKRCQISHGLSNFAGLMHIYAGVTFIVFMQTKELHEKSKSNKIDSGNGKASEKGVIFPMDPQLSFPL